MMSSYFQILKNLKNMEEKKCRNACFIRKNGGNGYEKNYGNRRQF